MRQARALTVFLAIFFSGFALGEVKYSITPLPEVGKLKVEMSYMANAGANELQMPNWSPGAYFLGAPGKNVSDFTLVADIGGTLTIDHATDNSWKFSLIEKQPVRVTYTVPVQFSEGAMHYSGPPTYLYIVGRKEEACRLTLNTPNEWKIAVGLDAVGGSYKVYKAPDYDVLADNPVTMGDFVELSYTSHNKPITIAMRGKPRFDVDKNKIINVCKKITDGQGDFFGGHPFSKYVWHFSVTPAQDGGGGLEHLSSTQISLAQGVGPRVTRVLAHEFFHLWNVKRIRSEVLGPFDYTKLPKTGALYWLEGTTDYYASLLCYRDSVLGRDAFIGDLIENTTAVRNNSARLRISPFESSMKVGESNEGRGNSNGFEISYYNLGWLVGLCLDIEIRDRTGGKKSLDDVERALWDLCKDNKPGFKEDEIRKQCIKIGGSEMGTFFDSAVMKAGELPLEEQLAKAGYKLYSEKQAYNDIGFEMRPSFGSREVRVVRLKDAAALTGLKENDVLVRFGDNILESVTDRSPTSAVQAWINALKPGDKVGVVVKRDGVEVSANLEVTTSFRTIWKVEEVADATKKELDLRNGWLKVGSTP